MRKQHTRRSPIAALAIATATLMLPAIAHAESYSALQSKGFKTSKLTHNKAGSMGWTVTDGKEGYFCKLAATIAIVDSKRLVSILPGGKMVKLDRAVFEQNIGGPDPSMPTLSNLKAGHPNASDVGACSKAK